MVFKNKLIRMPSMRHIAGGLLVLAYLEGTFALGTHLLKVIRTHHFVPSRIIAEIIPYLIISLILLSLAFFCFKCYPKGKKGIDGKGQRKYQELKMDVDLQGTKKIIFKNKSFQRVLTPTILGIIWAICWFAGTVILTIHIYKAHLMFSAGIVADIIRYLIGIPIVLPLLILYFRNSPREIQYNEGESYLIITSELFKSKKIMRKSGKIVFYLPSFRGGIVTAVFVKNYGILMISPHTYDSSELLLSLLV